MAIRGVLQKPCPTNGTFQRLCLYPRYCCKRVPTPDIVAKGCLPAGCCKGRNYSWDAEIVAIPEVVPGVAPACVIALVPGYVPTPQTVAAYVPCLEVVPGVAPVCVMAWVPGYVPTPQTVAAVRTSPRGCPRGCTCLCDSLGTRVRTYRSDCCSVRTLPRGFSRGHTCL